MERNLRLPLIALCTVLLVGTIKAQVLDYQWLNQPCEQFLSCDNGCSACNLPIGASPNFIGTNVVWTGIFTCPHPTSLGDNAVYTSGWPIEPEQNTFIALSGIALEPLQIDSLIIRHRRSADGPQRLKVTFTPNIMEVPYELGDVEVTQAFEETIFTDLGCLTASIEGTYATMQIRLQAFQGGAGEWHIDGLRVVASPCNSTVGIEENFQRDLNTSTNYVDVLGRPVHGNAAPGVYMGSRKRVTLY